MSVGEQCRQTLRTLEIDVKEGRLSVPTTLSSVFHVHGNMPSPLEEVQLIDSVVAHFASKGDDEAKFGLFCLLFPVGVDEEVNASRLTFLVKLASIALFVGYTPVLDMVGLWIKLRIGQALTGSVHQCSPPIRVDQPQWRAVITFITELTNDLLAAFDSPSPLLTDLPLIGPAFTEAFVCGLALTYSMVDHLDGHPDELSKPRLPPAPIVAALIEWLRTARGRAASDSLAWCRWTGIDWSLVARRYCQASTSSTLSQLALLLQHTPACPSAVQLIASRWTVLAPLMVDLNCSIGPTPLSKSPSKLSILLGQLHHELLQSLSIPFVESTTTSTSTSSSTTGHHHHQQPIIPFSSWLLCIGSKPPTSQYGLDRPRPSAVGQATLLRGLVESVAMAQGVTNNHNNWKLAVLRCVELIQLGWAVERLRSTSTMTHFPIGAGTIAVVFTGKILIEIESIILVIFSNLSIIVTLITTLLYPSKMKFPTFYHPYPVTGWSNGYVLKARSPVDIIILHVFLFLTTFLHTPSLLPRILYSLFTD